MPPRQEGPALAGGLCTGLQSFSPAFLAFTSVTVEKLQRLVPSFEAACASTEGVVRGPLSCLDAPRTLATDDLIGINSCHAPPRAPDRALTDLFTTALMATLPKIGSGTFFKRRLYVACSLGVPFLTLPKRGIYSNDLSFGGS